MNIQKGSVVLSLAGRDRGRLLAVTDSRDGGAVSISDGGERPLERPKRKNPRHLRPTGLVLPDEAFRGNRALKKALKECFLRSEVEKHV